MTDRLDIPTLLSELTLQEKAALCSGSGFWNTRRVERLGIPSVMVTDGPHGLRKQTDAGDHVGVGSSEPATCFPTAAALASTWDVDLIRRVGEALGREARAANVGVVLGPGINIKRSPLCGRNFEYFSEDPVLSGVLGAAMVDGIQSQGVGTSLKHFAANNQEDDRLRVSADIDERPLREVYLAGFERVVTSARPWTVMCSYNRINGVYASQDPWLLTEVLRDEWGFDGLVVSDWGAVADCVAAVRAGLDLEMPSTGGSSAARLVAAVEDGSLDVAALDRAVTRLLTLLERALPGVESSDTCDFDAHHALARAAAADGAVLLKNDTGLLPFGLEDGASLAVIGELARTPRYQGAGSSKVTPTRLDDAVGELRAGVASGVEIVFAAGYGLDDPADDAALLEEAVEAAREADVVALFLGLPAREESEGFDREHLDLPASQVALLRAVASVNPRIAVVLANGGVVTTSAWESDAEAILECWLGGQGGGGGVADVLLGRVNPSGRLGETVPVRLQDTPGYLNFPGEDRHVRYGEGLFVGYRYYDAVEREVSYPFGHGLSYTTFHYSELEVTALPGASASTDGHAPAVEVALTVTNTGERAGREVVQVYVSDPACSAVRPVRELKAFAKVALDPGRSTRVTVQLSRRDLSYWWPRAHGWVLEPGAFEVAVGASSRDVRLAATVQVDGPPLGLPLDRTSTLAEWLAHPVGEGVLVEALRTSPVGDLTPLLADPDGLRMIGSFPMTRLIAFFGSGFTVEMLDELLAQVASAAP